MGSLEYIQSATTLVKDFEADKKHYLMLLNDAALEISKKAKDNTRVGQYVVASKKGFNEKMIKIAQKIDWSQLNNVGWVIVDQYLITQIQAKDMRGQLVGTQLIAEPVKHLNKISNDILAQTIEQIMANLTVTLLMVLVLIVVIRGSVIRPVKALQKSFNAVINHGDFSLRVDTDHSKNEVNLMGQDFNGLMKSLQDIIASISQTMSEIEKGRLDSRVDTVAAGDLETLKDTVNETAAVLDKTMSEIVRVLAEMKQANFSSVEIANIESEGAFKDALTSLDQTIQSLKMAVDEINNSAEFMSHANFAHPVKADLSGDLGKLKDIMNHALSTLDSGFKGFTNSLTTLLWRFDCKR